MESDPNFKPTHNSKLFPNQELEEYAKGESGSHKYIFYHEESSNLTTENIVQMLYVR